MSNPRNSENTIISTKNKTMQHCLLKMAVLHSISNVNISFNSSTEISVGIQQYRRRQQTSQSRFVQWLFKEIIDEFCENSRHLFA